MSSIEDNKIIELFGQSTRLPKQPSWVESVESQWCPYTDSKCFKIRKSQPEISIGTCAVRYGRDKKDIIICPKRLLERKQVFTDCFHLLTLHEPGNELHVVPEVSMPGGSVDYFLVSANRGKVRDFVGIEFQTLDTTGTVWPERQRLLSFLALPVSPADVASTKRFGMNWKMTAKTILIQIHHKVMTLEHLGKRLVLVIQDYLLDYLQREFSFGHLNNGRIDDSMHIHSYGLIEDDHRFRIQFDQRLSTDAAGVARCLGIQAETQVGIETIAAELERKLSLQTLLALDAN